MGKMKIAPLKDYVNKQICEGDIIIHPSGQQGTVIFREDGETPNDQWFVDYGDGLESRLCLQVGDKGRAIVTQISDCDFGLQLNGEE